MNLREAISELNQINEKVELHDITLEKIRKETGRNNHTKSIIELAMAMGEIKTVKILQKVEEIHELERSLPTELGKYRNSFLTTLLVKARKKYSNYDEIEKAF